MSGGLGEFEFDEQNPDSFLKQLDKDEQEIKRTDLVRQATVIVDVIHWGGGGGGFFPF